MARNGNPNRKDTCLVLWLKTYIPTVAPIAPKKQATVHSHFSLIRQLRLTARLLSIPIMKKPSKLTAMSNTVITLSNLIPQIPSIFFVKNKNSHPSK